MRWAITAIVSCIGGLALPAAAQTTPNRPYPQPEPYQHDSGRKSGLTSATATVHDHEVTVEDGAWLRIYFSDIELEKGSFIRMTSVLDGEVQELDAAGAAMWNNASAYFNGNAVMVELVAQPGTTRNRFVIDRVASERVGTAQARGASGQCGICSTDDRVPSSELWTGRLAPAGCTASVWNEQSCLVSAGHCVGANNAIHFNVPDSNPNCTINQPPVADQFPITGSLSSNADPGNDWAVMTTGTNNLGQTIYERYGEFRPIAASPALVGQQCELTGYGKDTPCSVLSETQRTDSGPIVAVLANLYRFSIDLREGNSGSALTRNGEIVGIATHCPCFNYATRVDLAAFANARDTLCPAGGFCPTMAGDIDQDNDVDGDDVDGYIRAKLGQPPEPGEEQSCADFGNGTDINAENAAFIAALLSS